MTGETIRELLEPLIGESGSISLVVRRSGLIGFVTAENKKLTGVDHVVTHASHPGSERGHHLLASLG